MVVTGDRGEADVAYAVAVTFGSWSLTTREQTGRLVSDVVAIVTWRHPVWASWTWTRIRLQVTRTQWWIWESESFHVDQCESRTCRVVCSGRPLDG